jgi:hypothetical protein
MLCLFGRYKVGRLLLLLLVRAQLRLVELLLWSRMIVEVAVRLLQHAHTIVIVVVPKMLLRLLWMVQDIAGIVIVFEVLHLKII